jgi:uncharacterized peroxidase-related enzyme
MVAHNKGDEMPRLTPVNPANAAGKAKQLLDVVQARLGLTPNMMKTFANAPVVLEGYLNLNDALSRGLLSTQFREQIALAVAQANSCEYCLSAHSTLGSLAGLDADQIAASRSGRSDDTKREAGLKFAQAIVVNHGQVSDTQLGRVRAAGYTDGEIVEIVANVAINIFTNYFNHVAQTDVDFPRVDVALASV